MIRRALSAATQSPAFAGLVALLERLDTQRPGVLAVLTYHRVDESGARPHLSPALHSATPETFEAHMRYLAAHRHPVAIQDVLDAFEKGTRLPERAVLVTFDDAYSGFAGHAWPIMQRHAIPATLFVPTAFPDHPERGFWWDQLYAAISGTDRPFLDTPAGRLPLDTPAGRRRSFKRARSLVKALPHEQAMAWVRETCAALDAPPPRGDVLGWDALRRLAREGVTLGAHSQTHPLMNRISPEQARAEAVGSLRDLEREIGAVPPIFAYPSGGFNAEVVRGLDEAGFALAFTTVRGLNDLRRADRLRLRRINVGRLAPLAVVRAQLLNATIALNRWRSAGG